MRSFRRNNKGQFAVISALIIAVFTFSLVLSISQISLNRQELEYEPVQELALSIASDFDRCLSRALAIATQKYYSTGNPESAADEGIAYIEKWAEKTTASYGSLGLKITYSEPAFGFLWFGFAGRSWISSTTISVDVEAYGFKGLNLTSGKHVSINIIELNLVEIDAATCEATLQFQIKQSGKINAAADEPIPNLTPDLVQIKADDEPIEDFSLTPYLGEGKYNVTFELRLPAEVISLTVSTPEDGILVSAVKSTDVMYLTLQSDDVTTIDVVDNGGSIIVNGTLENLPCNLITFKGQSLNLTFLPPENSNFQIWKTDLGDFQISPSLDSDRIIITINGGSEGKVTAIYNTTVLPNNATVFISSRESNGQSWNKGKIYFNETEIGLWPNGVIITVPCGAYPISFFIDESGYSFKNWTSSETIGMSPNDNPTTVNIYGDGAITAFYEFSQPSDWSTLYLDKIEKTLVLSTYSTWSQDWGHETPTISHGQSKMLPVNSTLTPQELHLNSKINITLYMEADPVKCVKAVNVTFGYYKPDGDFAMLGNASIGVDYLKPYTIMLQPQNPSLLTVPEGSRFSLTIEVTFKSQPYGTLFIYFGIKGNKVTPSNIELFD